MADVPKGSLVLMKIKNDEPQPDVALLGRSLNNVNLHFE